MAVICTVNVCLTPRCLARHLTCCPISIKPVVTPPIDSSPVFFAEYLCRSILRARSKTTDKGASIKVSKISCGIMSCTKFCVNFVKLADIFGIGCQKLYKLDLRYRNGYKKNNNNGNTYSIRKVRFHTI